MSVSAASSTDTPPRNSLALSAHGTAMTANLKTASTPLPRKSIAYRSANLRPASSVYDGKVAP